MADTEFDAYLQRLYQIDAAASGTGSSRIKNLAKGIPALRARRTRCTKMLA